MARGELVPDEITISMIEDRSRRTTPSTASLRRLSATSLEAAALDAMLAGIGRGLDAILYFDLPDEVALDRCRSSPARGTRRRQRRGDAALAIYHEQTVPVVEHYRATGKLVLLTRRARSTPSGRRSRALSIP